MMTTYSPGPALTLLKRRFPNPYADPKNNVFPKVTSDELFDCGTVRMRADIMFFLA